MLKSIGFSDIIITKWEKETNDEYPEGIKKFTVEAKKPKN